MNLRHKPPRNTFDDDLFRLFDKTPKHVWFDLAFEFASQLCPLGVGTSIDRAWKDPHAEGSIVEHLRRGIERYK